MHPYREFVQQEMDARGWTQADLARHSGVHKAVVSRLLKDKRERLTRPPEHGTIEGLGRAFGGDAETRLWLRVAASMGLPVGEHPVADASKLSDDELLRELGGRLRRGRTLRSVPPLMEDPNVFDEEAAADRREGDRPPDEPEQ